MGPHASLIYKGAYYDAIDALEEIRETVIYNVLRSEILFRRGDFFGIINSNNGIFSPSKRN